MMIMIKEYKVIVKKVNKNNNVQTLTYDKIKNVISDNGRLSGLSDSIRIDGTRILGLVDDISFSEPYNVLVMHNGKVVNSLNGNVIFIALNERGDYESLTPKEIKLINTLIFNGSYCTFTEKGKDYTTNFIAI